jgi:hypothetical protein
MSNAPLFYEDFHVGQVFTSATHAMNRDRLVAFAAEFDPQLQHLDEQQAKSSHFGTLVASGWHTAALTMRLQLDAILGRISGGAMGAQVDTLAWRRRPARHDRGQGDAPHPLPPRPRAHHLRHHHPQPERRTRHGNDRSPDGSTPQPRYAMTGRPSSG